MSVPVSGRILALDVGRRRIGLAVSDALGITAQGLPTYERGNIRQDLIYFGTLCRERGIGSLLIGLPLHMRSGDESRQAEYVRDFAAKLKLETGLPIVFWDERLTTVAAERVLRESGIGLEKRKRAVDRLAAVILLESYLGALATRAAEEP